MVFPQSILHKLQANPSWIVVEQEEDDRIVRADELYLMTAKIASGMRQQGLQSGACVVFNLDISAQSLAAYLAAYACGCLIIDIRPGYSQSQLDHILAQAQGKLIDNLAVTKLLESPPEPLEVMAAAHSVARISYTSGSTGQPKGCAIGYAAMGENWPVKAENLSDELREFARHSRRFLLYGTLASVVVQDFMTMTITHGGTLVIPDLEKPLFPEAFSRLNITATLMGVPRFNQLMDLAKEQAIDLSNAQAILVSGAPISPRSLVTACQQFGPIFYNCYGQTEAGCICVNTPSEILAGHAGSVGKPLKNVDVDIRDGEVYVRSATATFEYWQAPELSREVFNDGWIRTRDCGYLKDGYLYLIGRARDVVMVNVLPVYTAPIEMALNEDPGVSQAYVLGVEDKQTGESVQAFILVREGYTVDKKSLCSCVEQALGKSSVPQGIHIIDKVPELPSGKVDKRALAAMLD